MVEQVTVIIPTYNCKQYILTALKSVFLQGIPCKIIVIDDASTDNTFEVISQFPYRNYIEYIRNEKNLGVAKSRNIGIQMTETKYLAFLDADDWWMKNKLKTQLDIMKGSDAVFCFTARKLYNQDGKPLNKIITIPKEITYTNLLKTNYVACSSVLIKTKVAKEILMEHDEFHEDYLMWLKVLKKYGIAYGINIPLLGSRLTKSGKSRKKGKSFSMTYGVYRCMGFNKITAIYFVGRHVIRSGLRYLL